MGVGAMHSVTDSGTSPVTSEEFASRALPFAPPISHKVRVYILKLPYSNEIGTSELISVRDASLTIGGSAPFRTKPD